MSIPCPEPLTGRRREIAAAARSLVAERGFEGLRTRDIADRVGINIATLHYHVPTKEALIELLALSMRDDFMAQNIARPREGRPPAERLRMELDDFRETLETDYELMLALAELIERARRDENVAAAIRPMQKHWRAQIETILAEGREDGSFRTDLDPSAAAIMVIGTLTTFPRFEGPNPKAFDRIAAELWRAIINPGRDDPPGPKILPGT